MAEQPCFTVGETVRPFTSAGNKLDLLNMKLFVWEDVLVDNSGGIMVVVAPDLETARAMLRAERFPNADIDKEPTNVDLTKPALFACWGSG